MKDTLHIYTRVSIGVQEEEGLISLEAQKELSIKKPKELGMNSPNDRKFA